MSGLTVAQMFGLPADWIISMAPQGTEEWLNARKGCITGSMAKVARDKLKNGDPSKPCITYLRDVARERVGAGSGDPVFETAAMRRGTEQEAFARRAYEARTGFMVDAAGFVCTPDRKFGVSIDGLVLDDPGKRGGIEIKTLVGSNVLFDALVHGDISAYMDQCDMNVWAWCLDWIDLCLWAPDLPEPEARLTVIRIERNQDRIDALLADLVQADRMAERFASELRAFMASRKATAEPEAAASQPATAPASTSTTASAALVEACF